MIAEVVCLGLNIPTMIRAKRESKLRQKMRLQSPADVNAVIKEAQDNGASDLELSQVKADAVINFCENLKEREKEKAKINKKLIKSVLDRATEKAGPTCNGKEMDSELYKRILCLQRVTDQFRYIDRAVHSQRLINYAIWKATDPEAIGIEGVLPEEDKMFINGICKELHIDPIYKNVGALDIQLYDPWKSNWNDQNYLVNLTALHELVTINLQDRLNRKINANVTGTTIDPNKISPIRFTATPGNATILVDPDVQVDNYSLGLLEAAIAPYYTDPVDHHFETLNDGNFKFVAKNPTNGVNEEFKFNIGFYGKDVVSLMVKNTLGDMICIHPNNTDIWDKVLKNCFYQLSDAETNEAMKAVSSYFWIYNSINMSVIPEADIIGILDVKLNGIFLNLQMQGITTGSYRFERYNSINDFILNGNDGSVIIYNGSEACYRLGAVYRNFNI